MESYLAKSMLCMPSTSVPLCCYQALPFAMVPGRGIAGHADLWHLSVLPLSGTTQTTKVDASAWVHQGACEQMLHQDTQRRLIHTALHTDHVLSLKVSSWGYLGIWPCPRMCAPNHKAPAVTTLSEHHPLTCLGVGT